MQRMISAKLVLITLLLLSISSLIHAGDNRPYRERHKEVINKSQKLVLADNGKALADIVIPEKCSEVVVFAAKELKKYLDEATAADFKILRSSSFKSRPEPVRTRTAIMLGESPWTKAMSGINFAALPKDSFVIKEVNGAIIIAGHDDPFTNPEKEMKARNGFWHHYDHATLFGVYDFLERFVGVRFYFPVKELIYVPKIKKLEVPAMDIEESPDFTARCAYWNPFSINAKQNKGDWAKNKMSKIRNLQTLYGRNETFQMPNCHGLQGLGLITRFGKSNPEYFAVMGNGKRANILRRKAPGEHGAHLCYNNKELEDEIFEDAKSFLSAESASVRNIKSRYKGIHWNRGVYYAYPGYFNIHPSDGMVKCLCPKCKPYADSDRISDLFFPFMARIAERLKKAGIKGTITTMPYSCYTATPKCDLPDNIEIMLATLGPWGENRLSNKELSKPDKLLVEWSRKNHGKTSSLWNYMISDRGMTQKGVPPMSPRDVSSYYKRNADVINGAFVQCGIWDILHNYLNMYVYYKTSWDTSTDVESLMKEHHENLFGPAAKPMGKFYDLLEKLWTNKGIPTIKNTPLGPVAVKRSQYEVWEKSYTTKELDKLTAYLNQAKKLAAKSPSHLKRIEFIKKYFLDSMKKERAKYMGLKREIDDVVMDVPMLQDSVKINGILDENIWKKASSVYLNPVVQNAPNLQTKVKAFCDKGWLFVGFNCQEPEAANLKLDVTKRDGRVWADSCVEVFLKLSNKREASDYYHFMVNAAGAIADEKRFTRRKGDWHWNCDNMQAVSRISDKSFTVEMRIPLEEILGRPIAPGDEFLANFARSRFLKNGSPKGMEPYYSWSPYIRFEGMGGFHDVLRYGLLRFVKDGEKKKTIIKNGSFEEATIKRVPGRCPLHWGGWWKPSRRNQPPYPLIDVDDTQRMQGKSSIKIQNTMLKPLDGKNKDVKVTLNQFIPEKEFKPSTTYLLTFYIKMENVKPLRKASLMGAFVRLALGDKHQVIFPKTSLYSGSMPWSKQGFTFTTPAKIGFSKSRKLQPHIWLCLWNATGTVWFDDIQIRPLNDLKKTLSGKL